VGTVDALPAGAGDGLGCRLHPVAANTPRTSASSNVENRRDDTGPVQATLERAITMAEKIRLRVWVMGIAPIVLVCAVATALVLAGRAPKRSSPVVASSSPVSEPEPTRPPAPIVTVAALPPTLPVAPSVAPAPSASQATTQSADPNDTVTSRDLIPELDPAVLHPPGYRTWTADQKAAYLQQLLDKLDARARSLQDGLVAAQRTGDTATEQRDSAALSYLRQQRELIQKVPTLPQSDAGS
jgi:hypothetical protein